MKWSFYLIENIYPIDPAWAAVEKTSLKMKLDIADHRCLDKFSSLKTETFFLKQLLMMNYHCWLGIWLRLTTSSSISPRDFSNNSS